MVSANKSAGRSRAPADQRRAPAQPGTRLKRSVPTPVRPGRGRSGESLCAVQTLVSALPGFVRAWEWEPGGQAPPSEGLPGPARHIPARLADAAGACSRASCCVGPQGLPGLLARARLSGQRSGPQLGAEFVTACSFVGSVTAYRLPLGTLADGLPEEGSGGGARPAEGTEELRRRRGAPGGRRAQESPVRQSVASAEAPCCNKLPGAVLLMVSGPPSEQPGQRPPPRPRKLGAAEQTHK